MTDTPAKIDTPSDTEPARNAEQRSQTKPKPTDRLRELPQYLVILHNDDQNDMLHVVESIEMVTPLARVRAIEVMFTAHQRGQALVVMTHKELAELYQQRMLSRGLIVTIEPAKPGDASE